MASTLGAGGSNQALTLTQGMRYSIVNQAALGHPFELLTVGSAPPTDDAIQLSQSIAGALEADSTINWTEVSTQEIQFDASASFAAAVDGYRCSVHTATMRGTITVQ